MARRQQRVSMKAAPSAIRPDIGIQPKFGTIFVCLAEFCDKKRYILWVRRIRYYSVFK
jgi:hypothetical protein